MTSNEIALIRQRDERRHQQRSDVEQARHNLASEQVQQYAAGAGYASAGAAMAAVAEQRRHNTEQELINWYQYQDPGSPQQRQATASLTQASAAMQRAGTEQGKLGESIRHNKVTEVTGLINAGANILGSFVPLIKQGGFKGGKAQTTAKPQTPASK